MSRRAVRDNDFVAHLAELSDPYFPGTRLHDGPPVIWGDHASYGVLSWIFVSHEAVQESFADAGVSPVSRPLD